MITMSKPVVTAILTAASWLLGVFVFPAQGQSTWYVAINGSDGASGGSWAASFRTISNAVARSSGNDTILVSNGVYVVTTHIVVDKGVTIRGVNGYVNTVVNGNYSTTSNRCFYLNHADAVVDGFTITNGYAPTTVLNGFGGGVYIGNGRVYNCYITGNNSAGNRGGGVYASVASAVISNCIICGNTSLSGGGVYLGAAGGRLTHSIIASNITDAGFTYSAGGGLEIDGNAIVENCKIIGNVITNGAPGQGGGVFIGGSSTMRNCLIADNQVYSSINAQPGGGGLYIWSNASNNIYSCTIVNNYTTNTAGGVYFYGAGTDMFYNCVIYLNKGINNTTSDWFFTSGDADPRKSNIFYTCTATNLPNASNITNNPMFVDFAGGNYRLQANSPSINTGSNQSWMTEGVDLDRRNRLDRFSRVADMGCYEYIPRGVMITGR